jgi:hypothetical protein
MKRIAIPALLVGCLLFSLPTQRSSANQEEQKQTIAPRWEKLSDEIQVMKLWKGSEGPRWPQVAALLLSIDEYKRYLEAPENYVNGYKIFAPSSTEKIFGCDYAFPPKAPTKDSGKAQCLVLVKHEQTTTSTGTSSCALGW